ncbi:hypothetical protein DFH07DRAFT_469373 [Mycena maculata]|uniref:Uncharacterized protein n=1 Tax=Mycena maculata TaxID=230809 RepID=A0AAD7KA42_9AGAR|nr:hypothetical protein DFH07DRAFT_469373 [Mycena maculata]
MLSLFPFPPPFLRSHLTVTSVPAGQVSSHKPYNLFASAAYCPADTTSMWSCGADHSETRPSRPSVTILMLRLAGTTFFQPRRTATQGNANLCTIRHGGRLCGWRRLPANSDFKPWLRGVMGRARRFVGYSIKQSYNIDFFQDSPNRTLFPGLEPEIRVHSSFAAEQAKTAEAVLAAVAEQANLVRFRREVACIKRAS